MQGGSHLQDQCSTCCYSLSLYFVKKKYAHGKRRSFGALTRILFIQRVLPVQSISHVLKSSIGRH